MGKAVRCGSLDRSFGPDVALLPAVALTLTDEEIRVVGEELLKDGLGLVRLHSHRYERPVGLLDEDRGGQRRSQTGSTGTRLAYPGSRGQRPQGGPVRRVGEPSVTRRHEPTAASLRTP